MRPVLISPREHVLMGAVFIIIQLICLLRRPELQLVRCQQVLSSAPDGQIEIRVGFLVGTQQRRPPGELKSSSAQPRRTYPNRAGRLMNHVFNYAIDKLNSEMAGLVDGHARAARHPAAGWPTPQASPADAASAPMTTTSQPLRPDQVGAPRPSVAQALRVEGRRARAQGRIMSEATFLNTTGGQVGRDVDGRQALGTRAPALTPEQPSNAAGGQAEEMARPQRAAVIFRPLVAETFADESESIKQTIDLITRQRAHLILGPQASTCQVEPIIAAIYNVPVLSHYCSHDQITTTIRPTTTSGSSKSSGAGAAGNVISGAQSTPTSDDHQHNERRVANPVVDQHQPPKVPLHGIGHSAGEGLRANTFIQSKPPVWKIVKRVISLLRNLIHRNHDRAYELVLLYHKDRAPLPAVKVGRTSTMAAPEAATAAAAASALSPDAWLPRDIDRHLLLTGNQGQSASPAASERLAGTLAFNHDHSDADEGDDGQEADATASARSSGPDRFEIISQLLEIELTRLVGVSGRCAVHSDARQEQKNSAPAGLPSATSNQSASVGLECGPAAPSAHSLAVLNWHTTFHYGYMRNPFRQVLRRHLVQRQRRRPPRQRQSRWAMINETVPTDQWSGRCVPMRVGAQAEQLTSWRPHAQPPSSSIYIVVGHYYEHLGLMLALDELGLLHDKSDQSKVGAQPQTAGADDDGDDEEGRQTKRPSAPHSPMADAAANRRGQWSRNGAAPHQSRRPPAIVIGVDIEPFEESDDSVRFLRGLLLDGGQPSLNANAADNSDEQSANSLASSYNNYLAVMPAKPSKSIELLDEMRHFYNKTQAPGGGGDDEDHQQQDLKLTRTSRQLKPQSESKNGSLLSIYDSNLLALKMLQFARLPVEAYYLYDSIMLLGAYYAECLASGAHVAHCSEGRRVFRWFSGRSYSGYADHLEARFDAQARAEGSYSLLARRLPLAAAQVRHNQSLDDALLEQLADDEFDIGPIARFKAPRDAIEFQVAPASIAPLWWPLWCAAADHSSARINSTIDCSIYHSALRDAPCANQSSTNGDANGRPDWALFDGEINLLVAFVGALICLALICVCLVATIALERARRGEAGAGAAGLSLNQLLLGCQSATVPDNSSWFGARDARNFLQIVHELLLMPGDSLINEAHERDELSELLAAAGKLAQLPEGHQSERLTGSARNRLAGATRQLCQQQQQQPRREEDEPSGNSTRSATYGAPDRAALRQNTAPTFHLDRSPATAPDQAERDPAGSVAVDLHCYMFAFPSCKFVHWLMALLKLKELLFKYQSNLRGLTGDMESGGLAESQHRRATLLQCARDKLMFQLPILRHSTESRDGRRREKLRNESGENNSNFGAGNSCATFFSGRHRHTATLRILLNKYKATNERLCQLSQLEHPNLVRLLGVTLAESRGYGLGESKAARLLLEPAGRGNLRHELRKLTASQQLDSRAASTFKRALWRPLLADLVEGLEFLHECLHIGFHGQLNSANCLLTADWRLKLTGFHVTHMRRSLGQYKMRLPAQAEGSQRVCVRKNNGFVCSYDGLYTMGAQECPHRDATEDEFDASLYMAPEVLAHADGNVLEGGRLATTTLGLHEMRLADMYAFAFVAFELLTSREPWSCRDDGAQLTNGSRQRHHGRAGRLIAERVKVDSSFRPPIERLDKILAILSPPSDQPASFIGADRRQAGFDDEVGAEDVDFSGQESSLLGAQLDTLRQGATEARINHPEVGVGGANKLPDGGKLKRLLEACWSKDSSARPQSVPALRCALQKAGVLTSSEGACATLSLGPTGRTLEGRLGQAGRLLELYTKLLERTSSARKRKLLAQRQVSAQLRLALLPVANFTSTSTHSALASFSRHHERVFVCLFRILSLTQAGWPQLEPLNRLLAQLDERVDSFRGHLHLWDSQVDSLMRFMVCASDPSSSSNSNSSGPRQSAVRKLPEIPYNRISLLTTFAFELIDMASEWQSKFGDQIQVRCALHLGQADGFCLMAPPARARQQAAQSHVLKLARYVMSGPAIEVARILEQTGQPQRIHISADYKAALLLEHERQACFGAASQRLEFNLKSLLPSVLNNTDANLVTAEQRQSYVIIRRSNKIQAKGFDQETHWLLNGPRVTASQRLMLPLEGGRDGSARVEGPVEEISNE